MNSRIFLLTVAVAAVGLFAMPNTLTLFSGQHTFYGPADVNCKKCHQDIYDEMNNNISTAHTTQNMTDRCVGCHRTGTLTGVPINGTDYTGTRVTDVKNNSQAHAAVTLECITCHTGVGNELTGKDEAHTAYYYGSISNKTNSSGTLGTDFNQTVIQLKGANTACVGCHTHITMNITWIRAKGYNMIANESTGSYNLTFLANQSSDNLNTTYSAGQ
ncbi:Class III cytochrome C family protein [uncultured archaeon]|nr:Class III cytochrome C family protein [uncultured archaeon]